MLNKQGILVLVRTGMNKLVKYFKLWLVLVFMLGLVACGSKDPQSALEQAALRLEESIKNKQASSVMQQVHDEFIAQKYYGPQEIRQQMLGLFMRYKNINILVVNRVCQLDKGFYDRGRCTAQVGITGAQGLIPERAEHYQVTSLWQLANKEWQLLQLDWQ